MIGKWPFCVRAAVKYSYVSRCLPSLLRALRVASDETSLQMFIVTAI
jgi:hypothetical protein